MREIIAICIVGVATLFGLPLWLIFIAGQEQEHVNPDIYEEESNGAWALDAKGEVHMQRSTPKSGALSVLKFRG
jgi:hypothetical protein